jgi:hypothetical protein
MTRSEKNSRIRGLPPRLILQTLDAHTGSLPSKTRIASHTRTGKYNIKFDDTIFQDLIWKNPYILKF